MAMTADDYTDEEAELEEDEDDYDSDEEQKNSSRRRSYLLHFPKVQSLLKEKYEDSEANLVTDKAEICCAICPNTQWFKGWKALVAHADTFKKKRIQQHRGYGDAIREALLVHGTVSSRKDSIPMETRTESFDPEVLSNHIIVWPPVVHVEIMDRRTELHALVLDFLDREVPHDWPVEFINISSSDGLLVFRGEAVGYLEATRVSAMFQDRNKCKDQREKIYGYLMRPSEMERIDPDREWVKWSEESYYLKVQQAQKKDKEEHENERAKLKKMERTVESLAESENKVKERIERFRRLLLFKQKETETLKRKAEDMEIEHQERMRRLEGHFQNEIKLLEATSAAKLKRWREHLQAGEKRLEEERLERMKEIEELQKQFQNVKQDIQQKEVKKAVEKELEVMQRKKTFLVEMANAEASFNKLARKQESDLEAKQHAEEMKLMEEAEKEREKLLKEWLAKQKEQPPVEEVSSCCMCTDPLIDFENRALLKPCGHARLCLDCANDVFDSDQRLCPICRQKIKERPVLLPKYY